MARKVQIEAGSDNIFADLGLPDAPPEKAVMVAVPL